MAKNTSKEVATTAKAAAAETTAVEKIAPAGALAATTASMFEGDAGAGMEGADSATFAIPFLTVLQGLSPQLETVDGAKPGLLINTITSELMPFAIVVPCAYQRKFLRWAPRAEGGGYRGEYPATDVELNRIEGLENVDGQFKVGDDDLKDTRNHYVLVESLKDGWQMALMSLGSTQIKKSKQWMSRIRSIELRSATGKAFNPPSFSHAYRVSTVKEENSKGAWWGLKIELMGPVTDAELYQKAKAFHDSVTKGEIETAQPPSDVAGDAGSGDGSGRF